LKLFQRFFKAAFIPIKLKTSFPFIGNFELSAYKMTQNKGKAFCNCVFDINLESISENRIKNPPLSGNQRKMHTESFEVEVMLRMKKQHTVRVSVEKGEVIGVHYIEQ
jgi:hypothetical protein